MLPLKHPVVDVVVGGEFGALGGRLGDGAIKISVVDAVRQGAHEDVQVGERTKDPTWCTNFRLGPVAKPHGTDVGVILENIALLYRATKRVVEALELEKRAERIAANSQCESFGFAHSTFGRVAHRH